MKPELVSIKANMNRMNDAIKILGSITLSHMPIYTKDLFIDAYNGLAKSHSKLCIHYYKSQNKAAQTCPHHYGPNKPKLLRVIYGYTDDSDDKLNARDGIDLYFAGCVPDGYGINIESGEWRYPTRYCKSCKKFSYYDTMEEALGESP